MEQKVKLKQELGLISITLSGVGIILGAGIYVLIGKAAGLAGNSVWLSFVLASLAAIFTGLSYAELSSLFPKASAEYEYTNRAFGKRAAFIIGWLTIISGIVGASTVALGFGGYFNELFNFPSIYAGLILIIALSAIIFYGIKESVWFVVICTLIEASGLLLVIVLGIPYLGKVNYLDFPFGFKGVFEAASLIFFAYIGFEGIVKMSEETKSPEKTIPKGLLLSIFISTLIYVLVAISAVSIIGWKGLSESEAPLAQIAFAALGKNAFIVLSLIALFATANTVLLTLLGSSRIMYGMADSLSLPNKLAAVHNSRRTPWLAILVTMILAMVFVLPGNITFAAKATNFLIFLTFIIINAAVIMLRFKKPHLERPFKIPITLFKIPIFPVLGLAFCVFMAFQLEKSVLILGVLLALIGGIISLTKRK